MDFTVTPQFGAVFIALSAIVLLGGLVTLAKGRGWLFVIALVFTAGSAWPITAFARPRADSLWARAVQTRHRA
jgi:hypothetical protein